MSRHGMDGMNKNSSNDLPEYRELRRPKVRSEDTVGSGDGVYQPVNTNAWRGQGRPVWSNDGGGDSCAQAMANMSLAGTYPVPTQQQQQQPYLEEQYRQPVTPIRPIKPEKSVLSPDAAVFIPRSLNNHIPAEQTPVSTISEEEDPQLEAYVSQALHATLQQVTINPGKFDSVVPSMVHEISPYVMQNTHVAKSVTTILFEQSVVERNFRYNGARICSLFCKDSDDKHTFRRMLLQRCQQEFQERNDMLKDPDLQERLRGFTHFMGEIFVNVEIKINNVSQKIDEIGKALLELFDTLLQLPNQDNLKCVAQLLKMSGESLEDFARRTGATQRMDKLFEKIHEFTTNASISKLMQEMFKNVEALRAINWGKQVQSTTPANFEQPAYDYPVDQPVLYGPDGLPMSLEEAQFLESNDGAVDFDDEEFEYNQSRCYPWSTNESTNDEDLDNEIAAAYEDYLRELGN